MSDKIRLDVAMTEQGFAQSREKAKALIMSGCVLVDNDKCDKAGTMINSSSTITIIGEKPKYVSRGGQKLEKLIVKHGIKLDNLICFDIGASTGGFTDCMLQNGASKVYAIDVGYGQLAWTLRNDSRVINLERTNIRHVTEKELPELCDFASIDVSFISLTLVLPVLLRFSKPGSRAVILVKPQFEAGKEKVGKKGVVRDSKVHFEVLKKIYDFCGENGFKILDVDFSPVKGPEGNIEYLYYIEKSYNQTEVTYDDLYAVVDKSHRNLD